MIDSHVHLWDPSKLPMPWLSGNEVLDREYSVHDFDTHAAGLDVEGIVYVEVDAAPQYALIEAHLARQQRGVLGVVAHAPVEYGERVRAYLDALGTIGSVIKGVRRLIQNERDADFCSRPDFVRGVQILPEYGLSFDACIRHWQFPALLELARRCPATQIILDHLGKPDIRAHLLDPWRDHMRALAELPNVVCKVSGVVTEAHHQAWTVEDVKLFISHALDVFGEDRVLFGGDWPVVLMASSYERWVATLRELAGESSKLWGDNARHAYRL
jgi:L-fuconolactonase